MKSGVLMAICLAMFGLTTAVRGSKEHGLSRSFYDYPQSGVVMFDLELRTLSFAPADITSLMRQSPMITADALLVWAAGSRLHISHNGMASRPADAREQTQSALAFCAPFWHFGRM